MNKKGFIFREENVAGQDRRFIMSEDFTQVYLGTGHFNNGSGQPVSPGAVVFGDTYRVSRLEKFRTSQYSKDLAQERFERGNLTWVEIPMSID